MSEEYTNYNNNEANICWKCGADKWPNTIACPVCGTPYEHNSNANRDTDRSYTSDRKSENRIQNVEMYRSPYERGVYSQKPEKEKKHYGGLGISFSTILKLLLILGLVAALIYFASGFITEYLDEKQQREYENQKIYQEVVDEARDIVEENNRAVEENYSSY